MKSNWKQQLAHTLQQPEKRKRKHQWFDTFLVVLILLNVAAIVMESVPSIAQAYATPFHWFEVFSVVIFSIEYIARVWLIPYSSNNKDTHSKIRFSYVFSLHAIIDLVAILPFYLSFFIPLDLRFLRAFRLLRIFKLTRYSKAMQLLACVFREEKNALIAAFSILFVVLIMASCGIYLIEYDVQPDKFGTIPDAMWWAMATLTTVGYGDVTPITPLGKVFGGIITIASMGMVALPAGILASGFIDQMQKRRQQFQIMLQQVLHDGQLESYEEKALEQLRTKLGIDEDEAKLLIKLAQKNAAKHPHFCPSCGEKLIK